VLAAYGQPGDTYRFYEINPLVVDLAEGKNDYFSFLSESPAEVEVILGDARISLEQELLAGQRQDFDVLILDTFSSDAIPVHLITREAFALYLEHLAPNGIIAAQITNKHIDLRPVIWQMGQEYGFNVVSVFRGKDLQHPESFSSHWMVLSRDRSFFEAPEIFEHADKMEGFTTNVHLWTDDYSNLFQVLK
jgi:spermidine synthase